MKDISVYKSKFYYLLETKLGDVKPLLTEEFKPTQQMLDMFKFPFNVNFKATDQSDWLNKAAEYLLYEAETLKKQKTNQNKEIKCDNCKVSINEKFSQDLSKNEFCNHHDLMSKKKWTCSEINAYAILVKTYGTSEYGKVLGEIKKIIGYDPSEDNHNALVIASIATAFIPVVGPYLSTVFGLADAAYYFGEKNYEEAGLALLLETIPLWGGALKLFRGGLKLSQNEAKALSQKIIRKETLTSAEQKIVKGVAQEADDAEKLYKSWLANKLKTSDLVSANTLKKLDNVVVGTKSVGGEVAKVEGISAAYHKIYQEATGASFKSAQKWFLSDKSLEDNTKMQMALKAGWKPGQPVPDEFRTKTYSQDLKDLEGLDYNSLETYLEDKNKS